MILKIKKKNFSKKKSQQFFENKNLEKFFEILQKKKK